jgi:hypothetical protein
LWPASSWIARAEAPRIARCEQKVCLSMCTPDSVSLALVAALRAIPWTTLAQSASHRLNLTMPQKVLSSFCKLLIGDLDTDQRPG